MMQSVAFQQLDKLCLVDRANAKKARMIDLLLGDVRRAADHQQRRIGRNSANDAPTSCLDRVTNLGAGNLVRFAGEQDALARQGLFHGVWLPVFRGGVLHV